jgi:hypothetical protein
MMSPVSKNPGYKKGERGQAIILVVFSIIGLIGMAALAIDGGNALIDRRRTETAASAAALTAALTRINGGDWRSAALATANANGYNNDGVTNIIEMNTPPLSGPYEGNSEYIEVIITSHLDTYFGPVIGVPRVTNVARAVTQTKPSEYGEMFGGYALVSLAPQSRCEDKKRSFWIHSEATISITGGGIFVNSDNKDCAFMQFGSGSVRIQDTSPITVVGGADIQKPQLITPYPIQTGAVPIPYPPAIKMPQVGCGSKVAAVDEFTGTSMSPGHWDSEGEEDFPPDGVTQLEHGTYCIRGDVVFGEATRLEGKNVLLIIEDGNFLVSGGAEVVLTAPQNGREKGLLIYMPITNHKRIALNGGPESKFRGTIFAPGGDIRINGMDSQYGFHSQIIGYYIEVDGQDDIPVFYNDNENYDTYNMPEVLLSE